MEAFRSGDEDASNDFRLTVDFIEFQNTTMAAKGTGFQPEAEAKKIKQIVARDKSAKMKSLTDTGRSESMFKRQYRVIKAKQGIDIDDKRDKFEMRKE